MATIILGGVLANKPGNGGEAWVALSWMRGLQDLGFDVVLVEQLPCRGYVDEGSLGELPQVTFFRHVTGQFGLRRNVALLDEQGQVLDGVTATELDRMASRAVALINISGHLTHPPLRERIAPKVYIDLDPGFTQFWHAAGTLGSHLDGYDGYYTVGLNVGRPSCTIPTNGLDWKPIVPPVVLDDWPVAAAPRRDRFTTVAHWRSPFGPVTFEGRTYGLKHHEFRKLGGLPSRVAAIWELALEIHSADARDREDLERNGWQVVPARNVSDDPLRFREYIQRSGAEFSAAQGLYVETESGWFSDRTVRYLASGKPVLVQETGFRQSLPVGEGLLSFRSMDEAAEGAARILADYERHARAARALAEARFDARRVLGRLVEAIGIRP